MWLLLSQVATWVMTLLVVLLMPGYLGAEGLGTFSFASTYVAFFTLAAGLGTSTLMTREIARDRSIVSVYVYNGIVLKLVLGTLLSALALLFGALLQFSGEVMLLVAVCCVGMYTLIINEVLYSGLAGLQRMGKSSAWTVIWVYTGSIGSLLVLANGGGPVSYALVLTAASFIPIIGNGLLVWPIVRGNNLHLDFGVWKHLFRAGAPLMLLTVFNQIYLTMDIPILAAVAGATTVGWYSLAYRWAGIPIFISGAVVHSHYPELSLLAKTGGPEFAQLVNRAAQLVLVASVPAGVGLAVIAPDLIEVVYGAEFAGAVRPLQILALQIPITGLDTILVTALVASDRLRKYLVVAGVAAVLNPIACIAAVHVAERVYANGAIGAALATAVTELFVMTCALALSERLVMDRAMVWWTLRCALAGLSIGLVGVFAGGTHLLVQIALGVACYAGAALLLGTLAFARPSVDRVVERLRARGRPDNAETGR